ncbi:PadR family transcriptional regulator (plasmid) [Deinococcus sp. D7000]|nr:PadR family transcriptional regulator [Deinococcus sp. D7000]
MTSQTRRLLLALLERFDQGHYGFDLMGRTGLHSGTLYPALIRLETEGLVTSTWEDIDPSAAGRPRRRLYQLTGPGIRLAEDLQRSATKLQGVVRHA